MLKLKFFWLLILFLVLLYFPNYKQTKKNLLCLVSIFIISCGFMIIDLGLEFLPFSYLLIYVGAIAVMFLFIIVAVDPFYETQKVAYEDSIFIAGIISNILTSFFYFLFSFCGGGFNNVSGMPGTKYYLFSEEKISTLDYMSQIIIVLFLTKGTIFNFMKQFVEEKASL